MIRASADRRQRTGVNVLRFIFVFFCLLSAVRRPLSAEASDPFFVTIQKVDLKNEMGEWVTVIEPDKKVDLALDEPTVSFFNNGRVPPGKYVNVRVQLDQGLISRAGDYVLPLNIKKGSFVNVSFGFDFTGHAKSLARDNFKQIQLTVDDEERLDGADQIKIEG